MADHGERWEVLAVLVALSGLVVPLAGAATYYGISDTAGSASNWVFPALGASSESDMLGPTLLVGALGLGALALRSPGRRRFGPMLAGLLVAAALFQALGFLASSYAIAWPSDGLLVDRVGRLALAGRWLTIAQSVLQAVLCLTVAAFAYRQHTDSTQEVAHVRA